MENTVIDSVTLAGSVADIDFSVWSLFMRSDLIVKSVIIVLLLASIWCWAIIFEKLLGIRKLNAGASQFEQSFWSGVSLDDLYSRTGNRPGDPMTAVFVAAMKEWKRAPSGGESDSTARVNLSERIDRV
ncbi:MAG: Tol-Pal system subunit TolQ, partial [Rhodospirillaceae bacterium]|nr:Tol-Pal system subunit TolQ [Rhodospirillaceae bacterium]